MDWTPISEADLSDLIIKAEFRMTPQLFRLWQTIKTTPQKWSEQQYGNAGGGFWVVALVGSNAIWYNDIEDGFNRSPYSLFGELDAYLCNQDELEAAIQNLLTLIETGIDDANRRGALEPVA